MIPNWMNSRWMTSKWWYVAGLVGGFMTVLIPPVTFWWSVLGCLIIAFNSYYLSQDN